MNLLRKSPLNQESTSATKRMVDAWREAYAVLEEERIQRLRELNEQDAARQFSVLLQIRRPYPLRPSSGLVEQQRLLARLRAPI